MKINYELELEDLIVFSNYLIKTSPLMLKTIRKGQMWWASGPLAGGLALSILRGYSPEQTLTILAILSAAISLPMFFMYTYYFKYRNRKQVKRLHENGSYKNILGTHEMIISDKHLTDKTADNDSKIKWNAINRIESTPEHTFVFTDDVTAYIVPHKKITGDNSSQFFKNLNDSFKRAGG